MTASMGLSDWTRLEESDESTSKFPFKLKFVPHSDVSTLFSGDFVDPNTGQGYDLRYNYDLTALIPEDSNLFEVYALDKPEELEGEESLIGTI